MLGNLLMSDALTGAITFFLGLAVVFFGIATLVLAVWAVGKILNSLNVKKEKKNTEKPAETADAVVEEGIPDQVVAAITAAVYAYMQANNEKCEFTVKKIIKRS
ncbi:MAG: OadG family protein [Clostridia bacterium]|nr:OadG family protein [Clostridia bacterium]